MPTEVMERAARLLLIFSLLAFAAVVCLGTLRASPAHLVMDTDPVVVQALQSFHSHLDSLAWLGAAALGAVLRLLAPTYRGPPWAPRALAPTYAAGAVLFPVAFAAKGIGLRLGVGPFVRPIAPLLASVGGLSLLAAAGCALVIAWSVVLTRP